MGLVIIAVGGRVGHFVMLCHWCPQTIFVSGEPLAQTRIQGNGSLLIGSFGRPIIPDPADQALFIHLARGEGENHGACLRWTLNPMSFTLRYTECITRPVVPF